MFNITDLEKDLKTIKEKYIKDINKQIELLIYDIIKENKNIEKIDKKLINKEFVLVFVLKNNQNFFIIINDYNNEENLSYIDKSTNNDFFLKLSKESINILKNLRDLINNLNIELPECLE